MQVARERERRLFRAARSGDERARAELIERYLPLARGVARRARLASESREDIEQVACLALVRAVDGFDVVRGTAFSSYAVPCISGAVKRHFRDHGWSMRVPRALQELAIQIEQLAQQHVTEAGRYATVGELAAAAGVAVEDVLDARVAHHTQYAASIDEPVRSAKQTDDEALLVDRLGDDDVELERIVERVSMDAALAELDDRERTVVSLYYREGLTQLQIGERIGYSQMHVSRMLAAAEGHLRSIVERQAAAGRVRSAA